MKKSLVIKSIAGVSMIVAASGVFLWRKEMQRDKLNEVAVTLAGKSATDCGRAVLPDTGDYDEYRFILPADHCTDLSFKARKPFFTRYDVKQPYQLPGTKATPIIYQAVVGTAQGKIYALATAHPDDKSTIKQRLVQNPRITKTYNRTYLMCP